MLPQQREVLFVDDDEDDRFLFAQAWKEAGIANPLRVLDSAAAALAYLTGEGAYADRARFPSPALLIIDIKMPKMSGLEALQALRAREATRRLPVIVLTASTAARDVDEAFRLGANSFVVKPSSLADLVELLGAFKGYWLRFNEFPASP